jgi:hypothetical protein
MGRVVVEVSKEGYDVLSTDLVVEGDANVSFVLQKSTATAAAR